MFIGAVVFGGICLLFLIGGAIYECCRDKDGVVLSDFAHGRIAATALGSIVLWAFSLFVVFTATAVCLAPEFPGRSIYAVALELAFNYKLYASEPIWTAPALAASSVAFVPFLIAAVFGLPMFRNIYAGYNDDYCDDEADAPEAEDFCCFFAPCRRRCGRAESMRRASSAAISASFAVPGTPRAPLQLPPQPRKYSSEGVVLDYCFTVCVLQFCATCFYNISAPVTETGLDLWPWFASIGGAFLGMIIFSMTLNHNFELLEIPSERARNERKQRWRSRRGFMSTNEYDHILEDEFGLMEICDTTTAVARKKEAIEMVPLSQLSPSPVDVRPSSEPVDLESEISNGNAKEEKEESGSASASESASEESSSQSSVSNEEESGEGSASESEHSESDNSKSESQQSKSESSHGSQSSHSESKQSKSGSASGSQSSRSESSASGSKSSKSQSSRSESSGSGSGSESGSVSESGSGSGSGSGSIS